MSTPLQQLAEHGQSVWIDYLSRRFVKDGDLKGLVEQGVVGVTSNPTIFQGAIAEGDAYDDQIRELSAELRRSQGDLLAARQGRHPRRLRHPAPGLGRGQRQGRLGLARGRPEPRARHRGHQVRGHAPARARRPPEPVHQDPGDGRGPAGDRGHDRRRHPGQRHADLLARAPPQGRRGLRRAASSASSTAAATRRTSPPSRRSSSRAWTPRPTSASTQLGGHDELKGKLAIANAKLAYQTYLEVFTDAGVGGAGGQGRDASSAACGRRPSTKNPAYQDIDLRRGARRARHGQHDAARDSSRRSTTTARSAATRSSRTSRARSAILDAFEAAGVSYDDVVADARARGRREVREVLRRPDRGPREQAQALVAA